MQQLCQAQHGSFFISQVLFLVYLTKSLKICGFRKLQSLCWVFDFMLVLDHHFLIFYFFFSQRIVQGGKREIKLCSSPHGWCKTLPLSAKVTMAALPNSVLVAVAC